MWTYTKDLAERVFWTFAEGVAAVATADQFNLVDATSWKGAALAALPAVYATIKGGIAKFVGDRSTAALLGKRSEG